MQSTNVGKFICNELRSHLSNFYFRLSVPWHVSFSDLHYGMCELKIPLRTLLEHPDFELFRTFRQISRNYRAARHLPCAVIKLFRSVDIGPMAHIPRHVPRRSLASSGPSIYREAAQIARNIAFLGIQYGRAPFFGKVPSVEFLLQKYKGA